MINWIEFNKDSLLTNVLVTIIFMPIIYIFTELMNNWRIEKKCVTKSNKKRKNPSLKKVSKLKETDINDIQKNEIIQEKIVYVNKTKNNYENNDESMFIFIGLLLVGGVWLLNTYKDIITNTIYWFALVNLILSLILLCREVKFPSTKGLQFLLGWTAFLWLCLMASMHLIYHPFYIPQEAINTQNKIQMGGGILDGGLKGLVYLLYQLLGFIVSVLILLFSAGAQIYTLTVWWYESKEFSNKVGRKTRVKVLKFLENLYYPTKKFVKYSIFQILCVFGLESGLIIYLFYKFDIL